MNISWTPVAGDERTVAPVLNIRLVIASPVRLVREGLAASLRGREGVNSGGRRRSRSTGNRADY